MPLFYQKNLNPGTKLAIWKIEEPEAFFSPTIPMIRQIPHPHKRLQHLAARFLLTHLYPDFPLHEIQIGLTRKPFLPDEQYHFSVSHCGDYAAAIVSTHLQVGIDAEMVNPRVVNIKHKFLHPHEIHFVHTLPATQQLDVLSVLWSAKEAMYKWYGKGMVDFKEMMHTQAFALQEDGVIKGQFINTEVNQELDLHYRLKNQLTLVWTMS